MNEIKCPTCGSVLKYLYGICADYDELCDCDSLYECESCGVSWVKPCPAHKGAIWSDSKELPEEGRAG